MKRLLSIIVVCFLMTILMSTAGLALEYKEAPMLNEKVESGELPSVSERLPQQPKVVEPYQEIGKYGGTLDVIRKSVRGWGIASYSTFEPLLKINRAGEVEANVARNWNFSNNKKTLTIYLREGLKWSDGEPFTADDIMFWYNDILLNEELTPSIYSFWKPGGKVIETKKVDDYTVEFNFAKSWYGGIYQIGRSVPLVPKHFCKKYHIDYNPDAEKLAKDAGHDFWYQLFEQKSIYNSMEHSMGEPVLSAWKLKVEAPSHLTFTRNSYYWKVDSEGNQLPYIDTIRSPLLEDQEVRATKVIAGEIDYAGPSDISVQKYPLIKKKEEDNNYNAWLIKNYDWACSVMLFFNHNIEDPVLNDLFNNQKFAQAVSLAIDREEVNEKVFLGQGTARQATVPPTSDFFKEEFAKAYTEYNPSRSRELLEEIGLEKNNEGFYLKPNSDETIHLVLEAGPWVSSHEPAAQLVADYLNNAGIKTTFKNTQELHQHADSNKLHVGIWIMNEARDWNIYKSAPWWSQGTLWGVQWQKWMDTDGESGIEPPADVKEFMELWQKLPYQASKEKQMELAHKALKMQQENLWMIGVVGLPKMFYVANNNLKNIKRSQNEGLYRVENFYLYQAFFDK